MDAQRVDVLSEHAWIEHATTFVGEIQDLLENTLVGTTTLETFETSKETFRSWFKISKELAIGRSGSNRLHLAVDFRLRPSNSRSGVAVEKSSIKVEFKATQRFVPIVRFEFDREARNKPSSHFQFHAESVPLGLLLARSGRYETAAQQQNIRFPLGDSQFRVTVEDVVELVVREFDAQPMPGWEERVEEGRRRFIEMQTEAVIRRDPAKAVEVLRSAGCYVQPPSEWTGVSPLAE